MYYSANGSWEETPRYIECQLDLLKYKEGAVYDEIVRVAGTKGITAKRAQYADDVVCLTTLCEEWLVSDVVIRDGKCRLTLYHKNIRNTQTCTGCRYTGYHLQWKKYTTIDALVSYIIEHQKRVYGI